MAEQSPMRPWQHRQISANGIRVHLAEAGAGPLVLLLHGFPELWSAWRHQFGPLLDAGFRVVAPDLRGYGETDKPPRGYDVFTLADDVAGLVRALGERTAVVVGANWGGVLAWATATLHPRVVTRLAVLSMPHPLRLRASAIRPRAVPDALRATLLYQIPRLPEARLTRADAAYVAAVMRQWSGPQWPGSEDFATAVRSYRTAMQAPAAAHCALEHYRWLFRSQWRPDGWRFARAMAQPISAPTLHLHGALDGCLPASTALGSGRYVAGRYEWHLLPGAGHFPHEEVPEQVSGHLVRWLKE